MGQHASVAYLPRLHAVVHGVEAATFSQARSAIDASLELLDPHIVVNRPSTSSLAGTIRDGSALRSVWDRPGAWRDGQPLLDARQAVESLVAGRAEPARLGYGSLQLERTIALPDGTRHAAPGIVTYGDVALELDRAALESASFTALDSLELHTRLGGFRGPEPMGASDIARPADLSAVMADSLNAPLLQRLASVDDAADAAALLRDAWDARQLARGSRGYVEVQLPDLDTARISQVRIWPASGMSGDGLAALHGQAATDAARAGVAEAARARNIPVVRVAAQLPDTPT